MRKLFWAALLLIVCVSPAWAGDKKITTAEGPMSFKLEGGVPPGAANDWAQVVLAGFFVRNDPPWFGWHFGFKPKRQDITKVEVYDISGDAPVLRVKDENFKVDENGNWRGESSTERLSAENQPWFFDFKHGQRGLAPNGIELHPVLAFASTSCRRD